MIIYRFDSDTDTICKALPILNDVPAAFVRDITQIGCPGLLQPTQQEKALVEEQLEKVWQLIGDTMAEYPFPVVGVYLYDDLQAADEYYMTVGMCNQQAGMDKASSRALIGIGRSAVKRGDDYLAFVLLHEMAHAATSVNHDDRFRQYLDYLIMSYNREYGTEIENDYQRDD